MLPAGLTFADYSQMWQVAPGQSSYVFLAQAAECRKLDHRPFRRVIQTSDNFLDVDPAQTHHKNTPPTQSGEN
jgi:hypothetical protein